MIFFIALVYCICGFFVSQSLTQWLPFYLLAQFVNANVVLNK